MVKVNKKYKDRLFRMVFNRKEELISLYNAISHSEYRIQKNWRFIRSKM